jgi:hypothetical protein
VGGGAVPRMRKVRISVGRGIPIHSIHDCLSASNEKGFCLLVLFYLTRPHGQVFNYEARIVVQCVSKYRMFQKEFYSCIRNLTGWRVLRNRSHLKA